MNSHSFISLILRSKSLLLVYITGFLTHALAFPPGYILIGDMLLPSGSEMDDTHRSGAYGIVGSSMNLTWSNNRIPYEFHSSIRQNNEFEKRIKLAMSDIMKAIPNCIRFEPKGEDDQHWLRIQNVDTRISNCFSEVGFRRKSPQIIELRPRCPQGTFVHEFLHTIGYLHEHTRSDRDYFVAINWDNIYNRFRGNYVMDKENTTVKPAYETSYYGVPYNYESIMHYPISGGNTAIEYDKPAMINKKNKTGMGVNKEPGQRYYLSHGDLIMIANKHACAMPKAYQYELTDAFDSSIADFESTDLWPIEDFEEPLYSEDEKDEDENNPDQNSTRINEIQLQLKLFQTV